MSIVPQVCHARLSEVAHRASAPQSKRRPSTALVGIDTSSCPSLHTSRPVVHSPRQMQARLRRQLRQRMKFIFLLYSPRCAPIAGDAADTLFRRNDTTIDTLYQLHRISHTAAFRCPTARLAQRIRPSGGNQTLSATSGVLTN